MRNPSIQCLGYVNGAQEGKVVFVPLSFEADYKCFSFL